MLLVARRFELVVETSHFATEGDERGLSDLRAEALAESFYFVEDGIVAPFGKGSPALGQEGAVKGAAAGRVDPDAVVPVFDFGVLLGAGFALQDAEEVLEGAGAAAVAGPGVEPAGVVGVPIVLRGVQSLKSVASRGSAPASTAAAASFASKSTTIRFILDRLPRVEASNVFSAYFQVLASIGL